MAKRKSAVKSTKLAVQPVAETKPVASAKLTRRNATPSTAVLVVTAKGSAKAPRAGHNQAAWEAVVKAAPAPAAELAALPVFADPRYQAALVSGPAFVSYMQRRGYLATK